MAPKQRDLAPGHALLRKLCEDMAGEGCTSLHLGRTTAEDGQRSISGCFEKPVRVPNQWAQPWRGIGPRLATEIHGDRGARQHRVRGRNILDCPLVLVLVLVLGRDSCGAVAAAYAALPDAYLAHVSTGVRRARRATSSSLSAGRTRRRSSSVKEARGR